MYLKNTSTIITDNTGALTHSPYDDVPVVFADGWDIVAKAVNKPAGSQ